MVRQRLLDLLAERIVLIRRSHPLRVAIDGIDAAGKTTLANELVEPIERQGRSVIRASLGGFHRPRAERYRQGEDSPRGYYEDSFDYPALREVLLLPLGPGGNRRYRTAVFEYVADAPVVALSLEAPPDAVLLVDGIFLLRPELSDLWDFRIFVDVSFEVALQRALARDRSLFSSSVDVEGRYRRRYLPAQELYLEGVRPKEQADVIVRNDDPLRARFSARDGAS